jgi:ABC-2 type transport system permease protein
VRHLVKYARLLGIQLRASSLLALQYRLDFVVDAVLSLCWIAASLVPLIVVFGQRPSIAGWRWPEALLVVAFFTTLKSILDGCIQPSLQAVVEHIRRGTLDFILLKPADAQFLVSTARFDLWKVSDLIAGVAMGVIALHRLGHVPSARALLVTSLLLGIAVLILYSIWILVISLAFSVVKVDNLSFLFSSIYDAARWPSSVFRGAVAFVFTFVIPLTVMTTYPALALLDRLAPWRAGVAGGGALLFAGVARVVWLRSLRRYTGAGG